MAGVKNVCFIGAGFVGGPSGAILACKNPDVEVNIVDLSSERIAAWNSDHLPIYEPGLLEAVKHARDQVNRPANLSFHTDVKSAIKRADVIFICVNTPTKTTGTGAGKAPNLAYFESAARMIALEADSDKIIVEKSTVPCRTADTVRQILKGIGRPGLRFDVLSNPEFLAEGTAVSDLLSPDRILIGSLQTGLKAAATLADLYAVWVPRDRILSMNIWSSELAKLAANALLAQRISSINSLSAICEATGADISEIAWAVGKDSRIGPKMLKASVGFGGSCFRKDILNLAYMAETLHLPEVATYWESVVKINEWQIDRFSRRIIRSLYNNVHGKKLTILGFAYKKDTSDTRESPAISLVRNLVYDGAHVSIYDPQVPEAAIKDELWNGGCPDVEDKVTICKDVYDSLGDAHAAVILTEWDEFSNKDVPQAPSWDHQLPHSPTESYDSGIELDSWDQSRHDSIVPAKPIGRLDWSRVFGLMEKPAYVFDGRRILDVEGLENIGFQVVSIGRGDTL